jgi:CRP/FNR family transcriptional regulator, anaerobic regulatory protein
MRQAATIPSDSLIDYLNRLTPLDPIEKEIVSTKFQPHVFLKKQFVSQHGEVCDFFYFVVRGCLRLYKTDVKGVCHILQFAIENFWIVDLASFHRRAPSNFDIDALEETVVLRISYNDLLDLYGRAPKFEKIFRVLLENRVMYEQERLGELFSLTAEERYQRFIENHPRLINRVSQVQIASYLGMTPEFLSRIRNRVTKPAIKSQLTN